MKSRDAGGGSALNHRPTAASINADNFLRQATSLIPAEVRMISGCEDQQTSADVSNVSNELPNPAGRAGGACTSQLLKILYRDQQQSQHGASQQTRRSFQDILMELRQNLQSGGYSQIPQLSSSRPLDLGETPFALGVGSGRKRALLVGINYNGSNALRGCHNDCMNMKRYLVTYHGFPEHDILVLMDDGKHQYPNRQNILRGLQALVKASAPGDSVFFHYSGHGGLLMPENNMFKSKQKDFDQTLIPLDHQRSGQIRDFSLFNHFVRPMAAGVTVTCLLDCCHSGSVLDLPYSFRATQIGERGAQLGGMVMTPQMDFLSNLAFLYILSGARLPAGFDDVTNHFEEVTDEDMTEYEGVLAEDAANDVDGGDIGYDVTGDGDGNGYDGAGDYTAGDGADAGYDGDIAGDYDGADAYGDDGYRDAVVADEGMQGYGYTGAGDAAAEDATYANAAQYGDAVPNYGEYAADDGNDAAAYNMLSDTGMADGGDGGGGWGGDEAGGFGGFDDGGGGWGGDGDDFDGGGNDCNFLSFLGMLLGGLLSGGGGDDDF
eukprot:CAMPEP_0119561616 /NCGR_PEP_ID=MMETSP1352-20130426/18149_1 /TAXON_ID=265584 /ORGANISM="Stauroneis constricta, Strain CCMP1120" /LENGTH=547 /DNA_ID=CAMNT_0007609859 /DNA_START=108 /DNA_END=1751 /DNA_ORIENTATION=-